MEARAANFGFSKKGQFFLLALIFFKTIILSALFPTSYISFWAAIFTYLGFFFHRIFYSIFGSLPSWEQVMICLIPPFFFKGPFLVFCWRPFFSLLFFLRTHFFFNGKFFWRPLFALEFFLHPLFPNSQSFLRVPCFLNEKYESNPF